MKYLLGILVVIFLWIIYFATQLSATHAPLESYQYSMTREELQERLFQAVKSNPKMTIYLKDSTGTDKKDLKYYADIVLAGETEEYEFTISYYKMDKLWSNNVKSEVSLIGAFDKVRGSGGYEIENDDVEKLISIFENQVINKIDKNSSL